MLISELKNNKNSYDNINVKNYIPFIEKKLLVNDVVNSCLEINEDGFLICDNFMKKLLLDLKIIIAYTDIEFGENIIEEYDFLAENKIINIVKKSISKDELDFIYKMTDKEIKQRMNIENSLANVMIKVTNNIIKKLPDEKEIEGLLDKTSETLNNVDLKNIELLKNIVDGEINE